MGNKIQVLCWSDCVFTSTGFGTVSKYILKELWKTGKFEISQLGINYFANFYDKEQYPYNVIPARLDNPQDPYGQQMFLQALSTGKYDLVFIINDTFVVQNVATKINEIRAHLRKEGRPVFKLIYYYPIDCHLLPQHATMVQVADQPVAYTKFGINETLKVCPDLADRLTYIYHGTDINNFRPLPDAVRMARRHAFLQAKPTDFVMVSVNRNSIRKDLPMTLLAFKKFKDKHPEANARLYLHTMPVDSHGYDLRVPLQELGLDPRTDVAFPVNYNTHTGFPIEVMNDIYNMADCFISTSLGEGWGLCVESKALIETNEGIKELRDIQVGQKVMSEDGKYHTVLNKLARYDKTLILKLNGCLKTKMTPEHPVLMLPSKSKSYDFYTKHADNMPIWKQVADLKPGDLVALPIPKLDKELPSSIDLKDWIDNIEYDDQYVWRKMGYSGKRTNGLSITDIQKQFNVSKRVAEDARRVVLGTSLPHRGLPNSIAYKVAQQIISKEQDVNNFIVKVNRFIPIDDKFLEFIGWYIAEGNNAAGTRFELDFHRKEFPIAEKLGRYVTKLGLLDVITEINDTNKSRLRVSTTILSEFLGKYCGIHAPNKQIPDSLYFSGHALAPLLQGYFFGDGHYAKTQRNREHWSCTTTSRKLAWQIRNILLSKDIYSCISTRLPGELGNYNIWALQIVGQSYKSFCEWLNIEYFECSSRNRARTHITINDKIFVPVVSVETSNESTEVMDLHVEDIHSYTANGIIVHNCDKESMAAGIPIIVPDNTVNPETVGQERGFMYQCNELKYIDNSGFRRVGTLNSIVETIERVYKLKKNKPELVQQKVRAARAFCEQYSWDVIGKQWIELFDKVLATPHKNFNLQPQSTGEFV